MCEIVGFFNFDRSTHNDGGRVLITPNGGA
jgi:hypothetical protein